MNRLTKTGLKIFLFPFLFIAVMVISPLWAIGETLDIINKVLK